jgi:hypothetical protein
MGVVSFRHMNLFGISLTYSNVKIQVDTTAVALAEPSQVNSVAAIRVCPQTAAVNVGAHPSTGQDLIDKRFNQTVRQHLAEALVTRPST